MDDETALLWIEVGRRDDDIARGIKDRHLRSQQADINGAKRYANRTIILLRCERIEIVVLPRRQSANRRRVKGAIAVAGGIQSNRGRKRAVGKIRIGANAVKTLDIGDIAG